MLEVGTIAPEFSLADQAGNTHTLKQYRGKRVVLYFYPKDDTPGCTAQACSFRDNLPRIEGIDAVVLGVSADDVKSHAKFVTKHKLNFTLLADEPKSGTPRMIDAYQSWVQKSMYGKTYMGVQRNTYLIDPAGRIECVWEKVKPEDHAAEVLVAMTGKADHQVEDKAAPAAKPAARKAKPSTKLKPATKAEAKPTKKLTKKLTKKVAAKSSAKAAKPAKKKKKLAKR